MKRALTATVLIIFFALIMIGAASAQEGLSGKWNVMVKAVDSANNPCPFIPDWMEFFNDGTVAMANLPAGMKMQYKTALSAEEAKTILAKFPHVKDKSHILLMKPSPQADWLTNSMVYRYSIKAGELTLELPGWTASRYGRSK